MHTYRNRARSMITALVLGAGVAAICGGTAFADQPWTHAGNDHHGSYQHGAPQGGWQQGSWHHRDSNHGHWQQQADNHGWSHQDHRDYRRHSDWHRHAWHHHAWRHHDHARGAWGYRAYPPVAYATPPRAYYAPPALSFGINIPLSGQDGH